MSGKLMGRKLIEEFCCFKVGSFFGTLFIAGLVIVFSGVSDFVCLP
jgi:hypothetical protein